jgi:hypothetical protein
MGPLQDALGCVAHPRIVIDNKDRRTVKPARGWVRSAGGSSSRGNSSASIK